MINFFNDVRLKHNAELRALRPHGKRYIALALVPPLGQFQNGERVKGWIVSGMLAGHGTQPAVPGPRQAAGKPCSGGR